MRIRYWSSELCSSDLDRIEQRLAPAACNSRDQNGNAEKEIGLALYKPRFEGVASNDREQDCVDRDDRRHHPGPLHLCVKTRHHAFTSPPEAGDRKSTRLNSSH